MRCIPGGRTAALSVILAASLAGAPALSADAEVAGVRVKAEASLAPMYDPKAERVRA